jgi:altronate dehydratase
VTTRHALLEGHRFAIKPIGAGDHIFSWGQPFGKALRPIAPGEWLVNAKALAELHRRGLATDVAHPNFVDFVKPAALSKEAFAPGARLPLNRATTTFDGFVRTEGRGVGTRNYLVVLPLSSRLNAFARSVEQRLRQHPSAAPGEGLDGVVALPHTEDGRAAGHVQQHTATPNTAANHGLLLRTLVGLLVHPNVGAAIVLEAAEDVALSGEASSRSDKAPAGVSFAMLEQVAAELGHTARVRATPHVVRALALQDFGSELAAVESTALELLPALRAATRQPCATSALIVAQQCGGSDAFSGTAANPLLADASKLVIEAGGGALLAETDELIGAEQYVLQNVSDYTTARKFLDFVARFQAYAAEHNTSAEGNPSGGNMLRGLYNIALKSLGAAMKRHPDVRLERVVEYAERLPPPKADEEAERTWEAIKSQAKVSEHAPPVAFQGCIGPGYCFMDSPGNDLESIAGQVAAGCNVIYFSTGNGSITNFPFVPTVKVISTTRRYKLMSSDMDVDAGDVSLSAEQRAVHLFELTLAVASGQRTRGEIAGHYQLQIWRNWTRGHMPPPPPTAVPAAHASLLATKTGDVTPVCIAPMRLAPIAASAMVQVEALQYQALPGPPSAAGSGKVEGATTEWVALLLPTSLCSSEVARTLANELDARHSHTGSVRFVALPHTEGCGLSDERIGAATLFGHLVSPLVKTCLLLEHGCEKTHNDYFASLLDSHGLDASQYGWASLQADGGVAAVKAKVTSWFSERLPPAPAPRHAARLSSLGIGLLIPTSLSRCSSDGDATKLPEGLALLFARLAGQFGRNGLVVLPQTSPLLTDAAFVDAAFAEPARSTLAYGQRAGHRPASHLLNAPSVSEASSGQESLPSRIAPSGVHIMQMPSSAWVETLTGIGASGVHMMIAWRPPAAPAPTGHPMVPLLSVALEEEAAVASTTPYADVILPRRSDPSRWNELLLERMRQLASGEYEPLARSQGNVDFQIARGTAVSL